jgi:uncharacterized membrane-anchored protein YhcB (DUF1043 family)
MTTHRPSVEARAATGVHPLVDGGARTIATPAAVIDDPGMSTTAPQPAQAPTGKSSRAWLWISAVLVIVCAGLLIWALSLNSDLNSTQTDLDKAQQDIAGLQQQADTAQDKGGTLVTAAKAAYDALIQQLGTTNEDLATSQQAVEDAQKAADDAQKVADSATDELDKAQAEIDVAQGKATVAANCAKSYIAAFGTLLDGDNLIEQAKTVGKQISSITDECKAAFAAS